MADPAQTSRPPDPQAVAVASVSPAPDPAAGEVLTFLPEKSLWRSIREEFHARLHPETLPPLELESKPVPVDELWERKRGFWGNGGSLLLHAIVIVLLVVPLFHPGVRKTLSNDLKVVDLSFPVITPPSTKRIGGGGGQHTIHAISAGRLPKFAKTPLALPTPPVVKPVLPEAPKLQVQPNIRLPQVNLPQFGSPTAPLAPPSPGNGAGGGLGPGTGAGLGPGSGGNMGGGSASYGAAISPPVPIYDPDPEYSDAARKAKYQGTVVLYVEIGVDGRAHNIKVIQPLGLGLDEKAIETVKTWIFKPARKRDGTPVVAAADIQVNFRLY